MVKNVFENYVMGLASDAAAFYLLDRYFFNKKFLYSGTTKNKNDEKFDKKVNFIIDSLSNIRDKYSEHLNREAVLAVELFLQQLHKKKKIIELNVGSDSFDKDGDDEVYAWVKTANGAWLIVIDSTEVKALKHNETVAGKNSKNIDLTHLTLGLNDDKKTMMDKIKGFFNKSDSYTIPLKPASGIYSKLSSVIK